MSLRLLTYDEFKRSDVLNEYGRSGGSTDFAVLCGGRINTMPNFCEYEKTKEGVIAMDYWIDKRTEEGGHYIHTNGTFYSEREEEFDFSYSRGIRPVIKIFDVPRGMIFNYEVQYVKDYRSRLESFTQWRFNGIPEEIQSSSVDWKEIKIKTVKYGFFPQNLAPKDISKTLENEFQAGTLKVSKQNFTTKISQNFSFFEAENLPVYKLNQARYVRLVCRDNIFQTNDFPSMLSDGSTLESHKVCWLEVSPIEWLIDEKNGILIAKNSLISGIPFHPNEDIKIGVFDYLNEYMQKEIQQGGEGTLYQYKRYLSQKIQNNKNEGLEFYRSVFEHMNSFLKTHDTQESEDEIKQFTKQAVIQMSSGQMTIDTFKNALNQNKAIYRLDNIR